jgi:NAD(P)-dependent dehydrogenase (short-subunit alcohol dehydrogenase family)
LLSRHRKAPEEACFVHDPSSLYIRKEPKGKNTISKTLRGKVALVTGGSRSIGAAIAKRVPAAGAAGALTYSASPHKADEVVRVIEAADGKALAVRADASDVAAVQAAVAKTVQSFGRLAILVNNAGMMIVKPVNDGFIPTKVRKLSQE